MSELDRTGERIDHDSCGCRNGWLSAHDADVAIPCPIHRSRRPSDVHDYAERVPSARARAAIERENRE